MEKVEMSFGDFKPFDIQEQSEEVRIFDIAPYSRHDGRGIRTVIYFQGCNARCEWCHSPHSQYQYSPLLYNSNVCTKCERCATCVNEVHLFHPEHRIDRSRCIQCGECIKRCPQSIGTVKGSALHLPTITLSVKSLFDEVLTFIRLGGKDGGITLSGGEALLQPEAARELLVRCKQNGIHTAVETSGLLSPDIYMSVAPFVDLWLFGMRVITGREHLRHDLHIDRILESLISVDAHILPRIPMVPGFFDKPDVIGSITGLLKKYNINTVCLNSWNQHYDVYYIQAGIPLRMEIPSTESIQTCENVLRTIFTHLNFEIYENN